MNEISIVIGMSVLTGFVAYRLSCRVTGIRVSRHGRSTRISRRSPAIALSRSRLGKAVEYLVPSRPEVEADQRSALLRSGMKMSPSSFHVLQVLLACAGLLTGSFADNPLILAPSGLLCGFALPYIYLARARVRRRNSIERDLPGALDIMCVCASAGSTLENSIRSVAESTNGPLAEGLRDVLAQSRYMDITEALQSFSDAVGLPPLIILSASLAMARSSGTRLIDVMHSQAKTVREYRRQKLEERVNRLPVELIIPIVFFIFPALFGVVLLPAVRQIISNMSGL